MFARTYPAAIAKQMLNVKLQTSQTPFLRTTARGRNRNTFRADIVFPRVRLALLDYCKFFNDLFRLLRIALYASWSSGPKLGEYRTQRLVLVF